MKAFLLAAGLGTRLRPITDQLPKCMIEIGDRPLLGIWLDAMAGSGVTEVLVNTHHLAPVVHAYLAGRTGAPLVHTVHEPELLGSAGTLRANRGFVAGEPMFLAVNADNLTDFDLSVLVEAHLAGGAVATLSLFRAPRPTECGIVEMDPDGRVVGFQEKPVEPVGDLANAGMYAFHPDVLDEIAEGTGTSIGTAPTPKDIGHHLLPGLVGRARGVPLGERYFIDIGTPAALERARDEWKTRCPS